MPDPELDVPSFGLGEVRPSLVSSSGALRGMNMDTDSMDSILLILAAFDTFACTALQVFNLFFKICQFVQLVSICQSICQFVNLCQFVSIC